MVRARFLSRKTSKAEANSDSSSSGATGAPGIPRRFAPGSFFKFWGRKRASSGVNKSDSQEAAIPGYCPNDDSSDSHARSLGLHVIHRPKTVAPVDIVFVHGLGGDSRKTWSKNHDPEYFWPELWLPRDSDINKARILSFGYNANFRPGSSKSTSNLSDFAKELLYELGFGKDENGKDLGIGSVPIVFVVHSMGGLVVKKAYLLGQNDERYQDIVRAISGITFLATPHRGSDLAQTLNRMLMVSFQTPKSFIGDLMRSSPAIEDLNEQFRHIAPKLSIVSFYEKLPTSIGLTKLMVVEKESSTLGYPKEISRGLQADHHEVCKYPHPEHSNYIAVRNALKSLVREFLADDAESYNISSNEAKDNELPFAAPPDPVEDFYSFRRQWVRGTCDWLLREPDVKSWLHGKLESNILWLSAPPGSGKSILTTHVINQLQNMGTTCQYFYFRFGDRMKSSLGTLLKSIAYQAARDIPTFKSALARLSEEGTKLDHADPTLIWHKVFELILFKIELPHPLCWVIDALDESESPRAILDLLAGISDSKTPIRLLIVSRRTESLVHAFNHLSESIPVKSFAAGSHQQVLKDINMVVERESKLLGVNDALKRRIVQSVMDRANGNFLWVQLVLKEIINCRSEDAIQAILDGVPNDMSILYQRMEQAIFANLRKNDRRLAKVLLGWVIFASRSLTLQELSLALSPEFPEFLNLERTIGDVCGQFILIDRAGRVAIIHQTARDYLIETSDEFSIDPSRAHEHLLIKTISTLQDPKLRMKLAQGQRTLHSMNPFVLYAATSWTYHLLHSDCTSDESLGTLMELFKKPYVLTWISLLAYINQLGILAKAADALTAFVVKNRKHNSIRNPTPHHLSDLQFLEQWAVDLVKVSCKFSRHLLMRPLAIYNLIPPVCPEESILRKQFHQPGLSDVLASGISNAVWNDNLARNSLPTGEKAWKIVCAGPHIAVLGSSGRIFIWDSHNFARICTLDPEEKVITICFNGNGTKIVSCGLKKSTKLWSIPSGKLLEEAPNPKRVTVKEMHFAEDDSKIFGGWDDRVIMYLATGDFASGWRVLDPGLLREEDVESEGIFVGSPVCVAFSKDASQVGVSYRAFPLSVWGLDEFNCIGRCKRPKELRPGQGNPPASWSPVNQFTFNPATSHVIGIYKNGAVFKWHPVTGEHIQGQLSRSAAFEVTASSDGKLFITSSVKGVVKIWSFANFNVIYKLPPGDLLTGFTFAPDCKRLYDIRGTAMNAWEPNGLRRISESEGFPEKSSSEEESTRCGSQPSDDCTKENGVISVLVPAPNDSFYCTGNDDGTVKLLETRTGRSIELKKFQKFFGTNLLAWAKDSRLIAASSFSHEVVVKRLVPGDGGIKDGMKVESMPCPKVEIRRNGIQHMALNSDASLLLLVNQYRGQILAVDSGTTTASSELVYDDTRIWLTHPTQNQFFLGIGAIDAKVYRWEDFKEQTCLVFSKDLQHLDHQIVSHPDQSGNVTGSNSDNPFEETSVVKAMHTQDGKHLLVQTICRLTRGRIQNHFLIFNVYDFEVGSDESPVPAMPSYFYIPPAIEENVEVPLGILAGSRLVFLDPDLWVCTVRLRSKEMDVKRHYFIPRDWTTNESLQQCCLLSDGTILCPKGGEVAMLMGDLDSVGF